MRVVIIEDEPKAAKGLENLLQELEPQMEVLAILESVKESVQFFEGVTSCDLIFSDIQLEDGLSFEIFENVNVKSPIIFITAYNQYAIQAFQTNGIGYLLKPVDRDQLQKTLQKHKQLTPGIALDKLLAMAANLSPEKSFKSRFLIKVGEKIQTVLTTDIIAFQSIEKATYVHTTDGRKHIVDYSLDQLERKLDPDEFFRINRKAIVSLQACNDLQSWSSSRIKVNLEGLETLDTVVARDRYRRFKDWLDR